MSLPLSSLSLTLALLFDLAGAGFFKRRAACLVLLGGVFFTRSDKQGMLSSLRMLNSFCEYEKGGITYMWNHETIHLHRPENHYKIKGGRVELLEAILW